MDEFKANLKALHTWASTWVVFLLTTVAAYWITLPVDVQSQVLAAFPVLKYVALAVGFIAFAVARATPQTPKA